jgi:hypothetical protein
MALWVDVRFQDGGYFWPEAEWRLSGCRQSKATYRPFEYSATSDYAQATDGAIVQRDDANPLARHGGAPSSAQYTTTRAVLG